VQKFLVALFYNIGTNAWGYAAVALVLVLLLLLSASTASFDEAYYKFVDYDEDRGAAMVSADVFGDSFSKVVYLDQGWEESDSLWFYNITQGSNLLPYDFFVALEQETSQELFRSPENMNRYRYLPQKKTKSNPDALPVGMVADTYRRKKFMGFTCAACHASQVNYNGVGIRIDGGPGAADMEGFMSALEKSIEATRKDEAKKQRFVAAVLAAGNYSNEEEVIRDLDTYALRVWVYNFINLSKLDDRKDEQGNDILVPYGYARLDAFGRIYNRVLEHILNPDSLRVVLSRALPPEETKRLLERMGPVLTAEDRDHLVERLGSLLDEKQWRELRDEVFNSPNAPVSYPFLWDIARHDYVQWNGIGANAGVGPIGRNTGEVIGVFATLDWAEKDGWSISSVIGGQGFGKTHISFRSSANAHNLRQIEDQLWSLQSPAWADAVEKAGLPAIDEERWARGKGLFDRRCGECHAEIDRSDDSRRIVAQMGKLGAVRTDGAMANNSVDYGGYSGILRNQYVKVDVGSVLLNTKAPVAALLTKATVSVVATPDYDKWFFTRGADWAVDLVNEYLGNRIKPSMKAGNYSPDTTAQPFDSLRAYKARALNGIWATAPYLHNGSVPTLYDLLLPASRREGDPEGTPYRPQKFRVGSRELDVEKVGFRHGEGEYAGFLFDTSLPSNSNAGHEYGTREMSDDDRRDLVEYLKSL
jgi:mono/diheme cytochrome c family protein